MFPWLAELVRSPLHLFSSLLCLQGATHGQERGCAGIKVRQQTSVLGRLHKPSLLQDKGAVRQTEADVQIVRDEEYSDARRRQSPERIHDYQSGGHVDRREWLIEDQVPWLDS